MPVYTPDYFPLELRQKQPRRELQRRSAAVRGGAARCSVPRVCGAADLFILVQLTCHQATTTTRGNISASKKVHPKDRDHGEGPYYGLLLVESDD